MLHSPSIIFVVRRRFASRLVCWSRNSAEGGAVFCKVEDDCVEVCECGSGEGSHKQGSHNLSQLLRSLGRYVIKSYLEVNAKKTKVMLFKRGRRAQKGFKRGRTMGKIFLWEC